MHLWPRDWQVRAACLLCASIALAGGAVAVEHTGQDLGVRTLATGNAGPGYLAIAAYATRLFLDTGDVGGGSRFQVLDAGTGRVVRTTHLAYPVTALVADDGSGHVFAASTERRGVLVFDAGTGALVRTLATTTTSTDLAVDQRAGRLYVAGSGFQWCSVAHGSCGDGSGAGGVSVFDTRTGRLLRLLRLWGGSMARLAIDGHRHRLVVESGTESGCRGGRVGQYLRYRTLAARASARIAEHR